MGARILIVESRYYAEIADALIEGAEREIGKSGAVSERVEVPGAFEIPGAIALAAGRYDGFVALGCVIRGETTHYDYVCGGAPAADGSVGSQQAAIGYGIVTVDTMARPGTASQTVATAGGDAASPGHGGAGRAGGTRER
jgi:6,7-dimethyl-8-ribityllumazine synthase